MKGGIELLPKLDRIIRSIDPLTEVVEQPKKIRSRLWSPKILGTGSFLPERIVTNEVVESILQLSPGVIERLTGVRERRLLLDSRTGCLDFEKPEVEMALYAASSALDRAGMKPSDVTFVLFGEVLSHDISWDQYGQMIDKIQYPQSTEENLVTSSIREFLIRMKMNTRFLPMIGGGCADALYSLHLLTPWFRMNKDRVLVVTSSAPSQYAWLHPQRDINNVLSYALFADAASALILDYSLSAYGGFKSFAQHDPSKEFMQIYPTQKPDSPDYIKAYVNHRLVSEVAPSALAQAIAEVLKKAELKAEDVWLLLHQPSRPTFKKILNLLESVDIRAVIGDIDRNRILTNYEKLGNTGFCSTLLLLDEGLRTERIQTGQRVVMAAVGSGLKYAAQLYMV